MPPSPSQIAIATIAEQLGALRENMERGREDRQDLKEQLSDLRQAINGLQQSAISGNAVLGELAKQNLAERIAKLENHYDEISKSLWPAERIGWIETRVMRWDGWIGGGKTFIFKVLLGVVGSAGVSGLIVAGILKLMGYK